MSSGTAGSSRSRPRPSTGSAPTRSTPRRWPGSSRRRAGRRTSRSSCWSTRSRWSSVSPREVPVRARRLMARYWPGALTLVLPAHADLPAALTAGTGTIGVRLSGHPVARALVAAVGEPVTAPSANLHGGRQPAHGRRGDRRARGPRRPRPGRRPDARRARLDRPGPHAPPPSFCGPGRRPDTGGSRGLTSSGDPGGVAQQSAGAWRTRLETGGRPRIWDWPTAGCYHACGSSDAPRERCDSRRRQEPADGRVPEGAPSVRWSPTDRAHCGDVAIGLVGLPGRHEHPRALRVSRPSDGG